MWEFDEVTEIGVWGAERTVTHVDRANVPETPSRVSPERLIPTNNNTGSNWQQGTHGTTDKAHGTTETGPINV